MDKRIAYHIPEVSNIKVLETSGADDQVHKLEAPCNMILQIDNLGRHVLKDIWKFKKNQVN